MNTAFVLVKPFAAKAAVVSYVSQKLKDHPAIQVSSEGTITSEQMSRDKMVDKHYSMIASKANAPKVTRFGPNVPQAAFTDAFGKPLSLMSKEGRLLFAEQAMHLLKCTAAELLEKWEQAKKEGKVHELAKGTWMAEMTAPEVEEEKDEKAEEEETKEETKETKETKETTEEGDEEKKEEGKGGKKGKGKGGKRDRKPVSGTIYVSNAFYPAMRDTYHADGAEVKYFVCSFNSSELSWKDFNEKIVGSSGSEEGTIAAHVSSKAKELGLDAEHKCLRMAVHGSSSPFESVLERMNWLKMSLGQDPVALSFQKILGTPKMRGWAQNPRIAVPNAPHAHVLDMLRGLDTALCLATVGMMDGRYTEHFPELREANHFLSKWQSQHDSVVKKDQFLRETFGKKGGKRRGGKGGKKGSRPGGKGSPML